MGHPLRRLRAGRLQGYAARVHAVEQADSGAEQHGRERDRELVDQAGVHVLQDRRAAARDADVAVARGGLRVVDHVPGQGFKGPRSPAEMAEEIRQAAQEAPEAIDRQRLPRSAKDMARGFFENLRGDKGKQP